MRQGGKHDGGSTEKHRLAIIMNPVPYGNELSLNVDETDNSIDIELAVSVAPHFGISGSQEKKEAMEIVETVKDKWEKKATEYGLSRSQLEEMRPAFGMM